MRFLPLFLVLSLLEASIPASAVTPGQIDDFQDGTTMGWKEGPFSPNQPTVVATGGPEGADDKYLSNISSGLEQEGGYMAMFNEDQWRGDYVAAGVSRIRAHMANAGDSTLYIRIGMEGGADATLYASTDAVPLPADGAWHVLEFDLGALSMITGSGTSTLAQVLSNVIHFRIHSARDFSWSGDRIAGSLGVDNIEAVDATNPVEPGSWGSLKRKYSP